MTNATSTPNIRRAFRRVKQTWSEMDYAQRRLFELRTGIPVTDAGRRATIDKLERAYALDSPARTDN
jgi:hypothetical protein